MAKESKKSEITELLKEISSKLTDLNDKKEDGLFCIIRAANFFRFSIVVTVCNHIFINKKKLAKQVLIEVRACR
jgi:hypothetical protein